MATSRLHAETGEAPHLFTSRWVLASACLARLTHRRRFARSVKAESSHAPS